MVYTQTTKMEHFTKIVNGFSLFLTAFSKNIESLSFKFLPVQVNGKDLHLISYTRTVKFKLCK